MVAMTVEWREAVEDRQDETPQDETMLLLRQRGSLLSLSRGPGRRVTQRPAAGVNHAVQSRIDAAGRVGELRARGSGE